MWRSIDRAHRGLHRRQHADSLGDGAVLVWTTSTEVDRTGKDYGVRPIPPDGWIGGDPGPATNAWISASPR